MGNNDPVGTPTRAQWYDQTWFLVVSLLFCFPVGLWVVWKRKPWARGLKVGITAVLAVLCVGAAASGSTGKPQPKVAAEVATTTSSSVVATSTTEQPTTTTRSTTTTLAPTTTRATVPPTTRAPVTTPRTAAPPPPTSPATTPGNGATALCRDGTYSYSQHASGTCSHHGGVAVWYKFH